MRYENLSKTSSNDPKILILGGGYIGNTLEDYLVNEGGVNVVVVRAKFTDYHDSKTLWRLLLQEEPVMVINCSGFTGVPNIDEAETKQDACWEYNVRSPLQVVKLCSQFGIKHMHISSGCIYDGYSKEFTEEDAPNFGLWDNSSVYSKTKHAYEFLSKDYASKILRIRMPFSGNSTRCYLSKIKSYDNLIDFRNSKTYIPDLCKVVKSFIQDSSHWVTQDIYNVVNPEPLTTKQVCELMFLARDYNPNWKFVGIDEIPIIAPRSNVILDNSKISGKVKLRTEFEALTDLYQTELSDLQLAPTMLT